MECNRNRPDINTTTVGGRGEWGAVYTSCHCPVTAGQKGGGGRWEMDIRDPPWAQPISPHPMVYRSMLGALASGYAKPREPARIASWSK